jgi:hypothetical protein
MLIKSKFASNYSIGPTASFIMGSIPIDLKTNRKSIYQTVTPSIARMNHPLNSTMDIFANRHASDLRYKLNKQIKNSMSKSKIIDKSKFWGFIITEIDLKVTNRTLMSENSKFLVGDSIASVERLPRHIIKSVRHPNITEVNDGPRTISKIRIKNLSKRMDNSKRNSFILQGSISPD